MSFFYIGQLFSDLFLLRFTNLISVKVLTRDGYEPVFFSAMNKMVPLNWYNLVIL